MKTLNFRHRDVYYTINELGQIKTNHTSDFSDNWIFLGGTKHHWSNHITVSLKECFENPKALEGCLGFDKDHGTMREWGGSYCGTLPRIRNVYIIEN